MSGHNKWSKIKRQKEVTDAKRSKIFSKHVRAIQAESRRAGGNLNDPGLRTAIDAAKRDNMPKDNIDRAVAKGQAGGSEAEEKITYEAYGPGGVAIIIEVLTDSRNRAAAEVRHTLSKNNGNIAEPGAASWAFQKSQDGEWEATTTVDISEEDAEKLEALVDALEDNDDVQGIYTNAADSE
jgi:YebC/PmpR family DNA-binding regulatory protein